ncbi:MAG: hypothetical protein FJ265_23185, partial [Planctomycetes bacterium]|nr:hypothetical protein [Planctomycetota bacterium]
MFALALAGDWRPFNLRNAPEQDVDPDVQRAITLLHGVRRVRGAARAAEVLEALGQARTVRDQHEAVDRLAGFDLRDAPRTLWPLLLNLAQGAAEPSPEVRGAPDPAAAQERKAKAWLRRSALGHWYGIARRGAPLPPAFVDLLPAVHRQTGEGQLVRELVDVAEAPAIAERVRATSEDPAKLAGWLAVLQAAGHEQRQQVLQLVGPALAGEVLRLPATGQLDWLELNRSATLPDAAWRALLAAPDVDLRRRAIRAAMLRAAEAPVAVDLLITTLQDDDEQVATLAAAALRSDQRAPDRVLAALVARAATAPPLLLGNLVRALRRRGNGAQARPTFDAAFAREEWEVRLSAAVALLG